MEMKNNQQKLGKRDKPNSDKENENGDLSENEMNDVYYYKEGLRFVKPYYHEFACFSKRRWIGAQLLEIYAKEFKAFSKNYYKCAIEYWKPENEKSKGKVTVNGKNVNADYLIKDGDKILHRTLRQETPVYDVDPGIIRETK